MNVVLLSVDCLRYDHVTPELTPNICALAERSVVFERCYSNGTYTRDAVQNLIASSYPSHHGGPGLAESQTPVSECLEPEYETALFHSNPNLRAEVGYHRGFDDVYDFGTLDDIDERWARENPVRAKLKAAATTLGLTSDGRAWDVGRRCVQLLFGSQNTIQYQPYATAEETIRGFDEWDPDDPHFGWVHLMDPHLPYTKRDEYIQADVPEDALESAAHRNLKDVGIDGDNPYDLTDDEVAAFRELYRSEIRYLDDVLGDFLSSMDDDTVLVLTADHGEYLFDGTDEFGHFAGIHDEIIHVPLLLAHPDLEPTTVREPVSLNDVPPTITEMCGVDTPDSYEGTSLRDASGSELVLGERTGARETPYLVFCETGTRRVGYYPDEQRWVELDEQDGRLDDIGPDQVDAKIETAIRSHLERSDTTGVDTVAPDEEARSRLEQLGYR